MAFSIDSLQTLRAVGTNVHMNDLSCKLWQPQPSSIAAVTGLAKKEDGWDSVAAAKAWLSKLSPSPTPQEVDKAMRGWGNQLIDYGTEHNWDMQLFGDSEIATLIIAFRSKSLSYFYKEVIAPENGKPKRNESDSSRELLSNDDGILAYSGVCRNFVGVHGGRRAIQITPAEEEPITRISDAMGSVKSSEQLGDLAKQLNEAFVAINQNHPDHIVGVEIGPPFQVATMEAGSNQWVLKLEPPCPIEDHTNP
jgi:hypothetical protein